MKEIAIVGANGNMGSWFTRYLSHKASVIRVFDVNPIVQNFPQNVVIESDILDCVGNADLVLISVPTQKTPEVIRQCADKMRHGRIIAEISSVKNSSFKALEQTRNDLIPLCIHPMFGPGAGPNIQKKVLLIPVRDGKKEHDIAMSLFDDNTFLHIIENAQLHDQSTATVLGLTYFINLVFVQMILESNLPTLNKVSGTTFRIQSTLAESILNNELELIMALITENPYAKKQIRRYLTIAKATMKNANSADAKNFENDVASLQSQLKKSGGVWHSYEKMYQIIDELAKLFDAKSK